MEPIVPVLIASVVVLVVWVVLLARKEQQAAIERNDARGKWAASKRLSITGRPVEGRAIYANQVYGISEEKLEPFNELLMPLKGVTYNFMEGQREGRSIRIFDHNHVTHTGNGPLVSPYAFVAVGTNVRSPGFAVRPHKFWDHVAALFGFRDIVIGSTLFDERFHVSSWDEPFMKALLDGRIQGSMLGQQDESWHGMNGYVVVVARGLCPEYRLERMLSDALVFAQRIEELNSSPLDATNLGK